MPSRIPIALKLFEGRVVDMARDSHRVHCFVVVAMRDSGRLCKAVGWAAGVDRLALLMDECGVRVEGGAPDVWVIQPRTKSQEEARANGKRSCCCVAVSLGDVKHLV